MTVCVKAKCVAAQLIPSPKAQDSVVQYRFMAAEAHNQTVGHGWLDGCIILSLATADAYRVGQVYKLDFAVVPA